MLGAPAWTYSKVRGSGSIHIRPKTLVEIQLPSPYSLKHGITVAWTHTLPLPTHVPAVPLPCSRVNNTYHSPFDLCFVEVSCALLGKRLDKEGAHAQKSSPTALRRHPQGSPRQYDMQTSTSCSYPASFLHERPTNLTQFKTVYYVEMQWRTRHTTFALG